MKIGIVGTGATGRELGKRWAVRGHDVLLGSDAGDAEAASFGDVVVFALEWAHATAAAGRFAQALAGKVVLDCADPGTLEQVDALDGPHRSLAEAIAAAAPDAAVVKLLSLDAIEQIPVPADPQFNVRDRPVVFACGDDADALQVAKSLADDIGFETAYVGPLVTARYAESLGALAALLTAQSSGFELTVRHRGNWQAPAA
jgi:predicted dinucleotide-binding enzyme